MRVKIVYAVISLALMMTPVLGQNVEPDERGYIVKIGDSVEDFEVRLLDGTTKKLSEFDAPALVLNFFASWCSVCSKEIPHIEKEIWQPMKEKGALVLGVDYKEAPKKVKKFVKEMDITYPVALDSSGAIFDRFARGGVTRNIVLDRDLNIIFLTRLFDPNEFQAMKKNIAQQLETENDSLAASADKSEKKETVYLTDLAKFGRQIPLIYKGTHQIHLEGSINAVKWRKLEIGISLFEQDVVSREYDKETKTFKIGYRHYSGVRIAVLPMTTFSVPKTVQRIVVFDAK